MSQKSTHEQDLELLREIAAGNLHAEQTLLAKYFAPIGEVIEHHLGNEAKSVADDLRQDLFMEIIVSARAGKIKIERSTFSAYLYSAARYKVCHYRKTPKVTLPLETDNPDKQAMIDQLIFKFLTGLQLEEPLLEPEELLTIISGLKPRDREILHERYFENLTSEETGQRHNMSAAAVRKVLQRAKESLRDRVKEFLGILVTIVLGRILILGMEFLMESA